MVSSCFSLLFHDTKGYSKNDFVMIHMNNWIANGNPSVLFLILNLYLKPISRRSVAVCIAFKRRIIT